MKIRRDREREGERERERERKRVQWLEIYVDRCTSCPFNRVVSYSLKGTV